jgi:integrase
MLEPFAPSGARGGTCASAADARAYRCARPPPEGQRIGGAHTRPLPRALPVAEIRRVMVRMGPRDRLIVEWALLTGARRMEIADLKFAQLPGIDSLRSEDRPEIPIRLETAKGAKPRHIYPPLALIESNPRLRARGACSYA